MFREVIVSSIWHALAVSRGLQSVRTRIAEGNKMTKKKNNAICDPDDSFVICFFDIDRLLSPSQPVPGSQFFRMIRDERKSKRVGQRVASHAVVFRRVAFHLLPCGEEVK